MGAADLGESIGSALRRRSLVHGDAAELWKGPSQRLKRGGDVRGLLGSEPAGDPGALELPVVRKGQAPVDVRTLFRSFELEPVFFIGDLGRDVMKDPVAEYRELIGPEGSGLVNESFLGLGDD